MSRGAAALAALALATTVGAASFDKPVFSDHWDKQYDGYFRKYAKRYFGPSFDWHWFKAQGIAESNLRPHARSSAGALGIMQILPSTYEEIRSQNPHFLAINEPRWNIAAAIYYDRMLYRRWVKRLPAKSERLNFTFASYNAGYGTIRRAQRRASRKESNPWSWETVAQHSPRETRFYVRRIARLMNH